MRLAQAHLRSDHVHSTYSHCVCLIQIIKHATHHGINNILIYKNRLYVILTLDKH